MIARAYKSLKFRAERALGLRPELQYHVISREPRIILAYDHPQIHGLVDLLGGPRVHLLIASAWTFEAESQLKTARDLIANARARNVVPLYLANSEREAAAARAANIPCLVCSHNALLDENVYRILPGVPKKHRAIYDARLTFFKRHELAAKVQGLALITYQLNLNDSPEYTARARELLRHAAWLNPEINGRVQAISAEQVTQALNESEVGLILSEIEGGNFSSAQYLLCGLPVVSTPSVGGRDAFFAPPYVEIVPPDADAVAAGVEKLIAMKLDPSSIRAETIKVMQAHRANLRAAIQRIYDEEGAKRRIDDEWPSVFVNKMMGNHSRRALRAFLNGK